jgi:hypothetical protein
MFPFYSFVSISFLCEFEHSIPLNPYNLSVAKDAKIGG